MSSVGKIVSLHVSLDDCGRFSDLRTPIEYKATFIHIPNELACLARFPTAEADEPTSLLSRSLYSLPSPLLVITFLLANSFMHCL